MDKVIAKNVLKMTSSILLISPRLHAILTELGFYGKLYTMLSSLRDQFQTEDILEICNSLFVLATKGYYYFIVERPLFLNKIGTLEEKLDNIPYSDFAPICKYIQIKEQFFLSMLLKCLFEWNASSKVKKFYLQILDHMTASSLSNAGACAQVIDD